MQGLLETLGEALFLRGLGPTLATVLMASAPRRTGRVELKKIFVLDDAGERVADHTLDPDCPIEYNDFLRVLPEDGIGDRESLFVGEYVFTAFQSGRAVYVLLSRGKLSPEDFEWIALLLKAADAQGRATPKGPQAPETSGAMDGDRAHAERETRLAAREAELASLEVKLKADDANLRGRAEELERQKAELADRANRVADAERKTADAEARSQADAASSLAKIQEGFVSERNALLASKAELEGKYRQALDQAESLRKAHQDALAVLERERVEWARRDADATKMRAEIESRVQELSQRFAGMAKDRLLQTHKSTLEPPDAVKQAIDLEKGQLAKERKFLQNRAIEILDMQERVAEREAKLVQREEALRRREDELSAHLAELEQTKAMIAQPPAGEAPDALDSARRDLDRRVKIIQQKALDLIDREEKLRKRAEELSALEDKLMGRVPAK
jgi:hypothetical protein